jgi:hypothetical protein
MLVDLVISSKQAYPLSQALITVGNEYPEQLLPLLRSSLVCYPTAATLLCSGLVYYPTAATTVL